MKKLSFVIAFMFAVLLIGTVSALDFDNVKSYDLNQKQITITNAFGFGGTLAEYKLTYNTNQCLINCEAQGVAVLYSNGMLFNKFSFKDGSGNSIPLNSFEVFIEDEKTESKTVPVYETVCTPTGKVNVNGTIEETCITEKIKDETVSETKKYWKVYNGEILSNGTYKWKIGGEKPRNQNIDWIGSAFGEELKEWAWWNSDWSYRKEVNVRGDTNEVLYNFTVLLNVTYDSNMQTDFEDLRFVNGTCIGTQDTELEYEFDSVIASNSALVWVKIPVLSTGTNPICMYYGNALSTNSSDYINAWDDYYKGVYHFTDSGNGTSYLDSRGNGNGTASDGTPLIVPSKIGNGINISASRDVHLFSNTQVQFTDAPFTLEIFGNPSSYYSPVSAYISGGTGMYGGYISDVGVIKFGKLGTDESISGLTAGLNTWNYISVRYDASDSLTFILNQTQTNTQAYSTTFSASTIRIGDGVGNYWIGDLDEARFSNVSRSSGWLNRSYQNANFSMVTFSGEETPSISIEQSYPINNFNTTTKSVSIGCNFSSSLNNITTVKLSIYNNSNYLTYTNNETGLNKTSYNKTWITDSLPNNIYKWYCSGYGTGGSNETTVNRTLQVTNVIINNVTYNSTSYVTSTEQFKLNISTDGTEIPIPYLYYNNTRYSSTLSGDEYISSVSITFAGNNSFVWAINYGSYQINSSTYYQLVSDVNAMTVVSGACSAGLSKVMNFTFKDENNNTGIPDVINKYNFKYGISNSSGATTNGNITATELSICLNTTLSSTYTIGYGEIEYSKSGYSTRRYYVFEGTRVSNVTIYNPLYLLPSSDSTSFLIEVRDPTLSPYINKYTTLLKWFPELNEYKVVEMGKTDDKGQTVNKVKIEDVDYRVGIYDVDGTLIYLANPIRMVCLASPCSYTLTVKSSSDYEFDDIYNIQSSLVFSSGVFTLTYNDPSQNTERITLDVYKIGGTASDDLLCSTNGTSFTGILTCNVSSQSGILKGVAYRTASPSYPIVSLIVDTVTTVFQGTFGLFLQFLLFLTITFLGIFNPIIGIILGLISLMFGVFLFKTITYPIFIGVAVLSGLVIHFIKNANR